MLVLGSHPVRAHWHLIDLSSTHTGTNHSLQRAYTAWCHRGATSTSPFTGRIGRPGPQGRGRQCAVGDHHVRASTSDRLLTCELQRTFRVAHSHGFACRSRARLSTASSVGARNPYRVPCASRGSSGPALDHRNCPCADTTSPRRIAQVGSGPVDGHHQRHSCAVTNCGPAPSRSCAKPQGLQASTTTVPRRASLRCVGPTHAAGSPGRRFRRFGAHRPASRHGGPTDGR